LRAGRKGDARGYGTGDVEAGDDRVGDGFGAGVRKQPALEPRFAGSGGAIGEIGAQDRSAQRGFGAQPGERRKGGEGDADGAEGLAFLLVGEDQAAAQGGFGERAGFGVERQGGGPVVFTPERAIAGVFEKDRAAQGEILAGHGEADRVRRREIGIGSAAGDGLGVGGPARLDARRERGGRLGEGRAAGQADQEDGRSKDVHLSSPTTNVHAPDGQIEGDHGAAW
jgi:hypothetical protein